MNILKVGNLYKINITVQQITPLILILKIQNFLVGKTFHPYYSRGLKDEYNMNHNFIFRWFKYSIKN